MAQGDERDLIIGLLVPRVAGVTTEQMMPVLEAWGSQKEKSLLEVCVEMGVITAAQGAEIVSRADEIIRRAGGDTSRALEQLIGCETPTELASELPVIAGRYTGIREIPIGNLGWVCVARDDRLKRLVAVKLIKPDRKKTTERAQFDETQFDREMQVTAALEHPNIVPVYDGGKDAGKPFYVMRHIPGDSLQEAIARHHPAPPEQSPGERSLALRDLLGRFASVCEAAAYAHSKQIIHRDIKPANIMVGAFGESQLIDWGLAKVADHLGAPAASGTPAYMAPEQVEGDGDRIGPATDIYALGGTLYHILTGRSAFQGDRSEFRHDVTRGNFPQPRQVNPEVAPALESICLKAMAREPGDRYSTAKDLAADIERWLADEPVSVYREPWTKQVFRFAKRNRTAMTAAGVLVATAVMWISAGYVIVSRQLAITALAERKAALRRDELAMNVQETLEVIDTFLLRMAADDWARFPGSEVARREMADKAIRKLQDIQSHSSDDNGLTYGIARAERIAGLLALVTADQAAAERYFDDAHTLLSRLVGPRVSGDYRPHDTFANLLLDQSDLAMQTDGPGKAVEYLKTARKVSGMIPPERVARLLGRVAAAWGNHLLAVERWDEAVAEFKVATQCFDENPPQGSKSLEILHARAWQDLGLAERRSGRSDGSVAWQRARDLIEASRTRWPDDPTVLATAAAFTVREAEYDEAGITDERLRKALDEVVGELDRLVIAFRETAGYRLIAARARVVRAEKAVAAGQHAAGRVDADRAIELAKTDAKETGTADWRDLEILARAYAARGRASPPPDAVNDLREACRLWQIVVARNPAQRSSEQAAEAARRDLAKAQSTMP